jgi:hypothetical protein
VRFEADPAIYLAKGADSSPGFSIKPQVTAEELDAVVIRLSDATDEGVRLRLDTIVLVEGGPEVYADRIKQLEDIYAEQQRSLEAALRKCQADRR